MHRSIETILDRRAILTGAAAVPLAVATAIPAASATPESPYSAAAVTQRVNDFAALMDVPAVVIESDADGIAILSDSLTEWCATHGASVDWIACGDMRSMFRLAQAHHQRVQPAPPMEDPVLPLYRDWVAAGVGMDEAHEAGDEPSYQRHYADWWRVARKLVEARPNSLKGVACKLDFIRGHFHVEGSGWAGDLDYIAHNGTLNALADMIGMQGPFVGGRWQILRAV